MFNKKNDSPGGFPLTSSNTPMPKTKPPKNTPESYTNFKIVDSLWFKGFFILIGIVIAKDTITNKIKCYIGIAAGKNKKEDEIFILNNGVKFDIDFVYNTILKREHEAKATKKKNVEKYSEKKEPL